VWKKGYRAAETHATSESGTPTTNHQTWSYRFLGFVSVSGNLLRVTNNKVDIKPIELCDPPAEQFVLDQETRDWL
jgi:hypothetical protein